MSVRANSDKAKYIQELFQYNFCVGSRENEKALEIYLTSFNTTSVSVRVYQTSQEVFPSKEFQYNFCVGSSI